ncbi:RNA methyltransferase [Thalassolituus sp. C2-1]|uniref:RNA methyltransferase n=1 Tax=Venatorbacter sp. C2-1 TaxID=2597518 RepID=UPI0011963BDF|nr:RNA methyltransferase [Thalassolituus sp. C2-1]TVV42222.1 RNA methyltransferase [Thalassolituus sp. C2-1]
MVYLGLENPKDAGNVGSVLRALGCYQADGIFYTGSRYDRAVKHSPDTRNVAQIAHVDSLLMAKDRLPEHTSLICVELVIGATSLPDFKHPEHALYVFGPEDGSISQDIVRAADEVVYIPTVGCMNLAATVNVVLYDRLAKLGPVKGIKSGDELIKSSRDNRNRLRL